MRHTQTFIEGSRQTTPRVQQQQQQSCPLDHQVAPKPVFRSLRHPPRRTRHELQHAPCSTVSERVEQQQQLQQGIHQHRRALLIAAGLCPLLTAAVSTPATAQAADSISQSVESAVGTSGTGDTTSQQQQQQSPAGSEVSGLGADADAAASASESVAGGAADQASSDDLPSQVLEENDDDDSSSSSSSDSDSDSDSSSDDEPGGAERRHSSDLHVCWV